MTLTARQLEILQHTLGLDKYGQLPRAANGCEFRNRFCAGGDDEVICRELVDMGLMFMFHPNASPLPYYNCAVTDAGRMVVREQSPTPPKLSLYQRQANPGSAVGPDFSFRDYLQSQGGGA